MNGLASACLTLILISATPLLAQNVVGYRETTWTYTTSNGPKTIRLAVWYPSSGTPRSTKYAYISGAVVQDGPLPSSVPAIVALSHGMWECGSSMAYVAQSLAASGVVVVAPDHEDAAFCLIGGGTAPTAPRNWQSPRRPSDLRAAIDAVASMGITAQVISAGHSLGGWTALAINGSMPLETDSRVIGSILLSPSANSGNDYYASAHPPLLYLFGQMEGNKSAPYAASHAPKYYDIVPYAGHYAFTDRVCDMWGTVESCVAANASAGRVVEMSRAFVAAFVSGAATAFDTLRTADMWDEEN